MKKLVIITGLFLATSIGVIAQKAPPVKEAMENLPKASKPKPQYTRPSKPVVTTGNRTAVWTGKKEVKTNNGVRRHGFKHHGKKWKKHHKRHKMVK